MDEMIQAVSRYLNGTYLKVEWKNGQVILEGKIDTIYESNNGLDENDKAYKEFYACAFRIEKVLSNSANEGYAINGLLEISIENQPTLIALQDGYVIWKKK